MILKLLMIIFLMVVLFYSKNFLELNRKKKIFKVKKLKTFNRKNLNSWMNLTKKERYNLSKKDSVDYMDRRKLLLNEIRKEYKKISSQNSEGHIKEK